MILFVYAVMEARCHLSPLIEPIGRKPYLKKWIDHKSDHNGSKTTQRQNQFNDIYRYFFQILEKENLELAYKFRYTVEAAGSAPFIERQDQLDRALKRAKNKAFEPLEKLLQQIQIDLGLDYDQQSATLRIKRPILREAIRLDPEYEDAILPYIPDLTTPDNTDHHIPFGRYAWQQPPEETPEIGDDALVAAEKEFGPHEKLNQDQNDQAFDDQTADIEETQEVDSLLNQIPENLNVLSELTEDDAPSDSPAIPEIQIAAKSEATPSQEKSPDTEPGVATPHTAVTNKDAVVQDTLKAKQFDPEYSAPEEITIQPEDESSTKSGLTENDKDIVEETLPAGEMQSLTADSAISGQKLKGGSPLPIYSDEDPHNKESAAEFETTDTIQNISHSEVIPEQSLEPEEVEVAADKLVLPADESLPDVDQIEAETQSVPDAALDSSSLKSNQIADSSNFKSIESIVEHSEQTFPEIIDSDETIEQNADFFEQSQSLKSSGATKQDDPGNIDSDSNEDNLTEPSKHKSLVGVSKDDGLRSADRSFMKALKSPIHHLKEKLSLKDNRPAPLDEISDENKEHQPNLPKSKRKKLSLPFKIRRSSDSPAEEKHTEVNTYSADKKKQMNYNQDAFKLPGEIDKEAESNADNENLVTASSKTESEKSLNDLKEYADPRIGLIQSRKELILRINKKEENSKNGEAGNPNWTEKSVVASSPPPPLYNFKFTLRKPIIHGTPDIYDHGTALVIFKDCIERRSETYAEKRHFFAGSSTWNYFQRKDYRPFYRDTASLVIQKDCIDHRILHNPLPAKHTLEMSSSELETFKAFDSFYNESENYGKELYFPENNDSFFDGTDDYSYFDPHEEELKEQALHEKKRNELYQSCLDRISHKEGLLFDFKAGKIAIDNTDKHEIERWVRAQQSESIEMYRAYAEAIMHPEIESVTGVQEFVRSKLKKADFPNQRVTNIFDKLKENSYSVELKRYDLVGILKRQDYVSVNSDSLSETMSFSNSYSRYRAWRETVESPKIEVRPVSAGEHRPIIPFESFRKSWSYLDTPKISVRSSSDYQFKRTLPVFDKIFSWRKSHS